MSKIRKINMAATFDAIMKREKVFIAYQLADILMFLYFETGNTQTDYGSGWNDIRKAIREIFDTDNWVVREYKK